MSMKKKIIREEKSKKVEVLPINPIDPDSELIEFVKRNHQAAVDYRGKFKGAWDRIIEQIRCVHPSAWGEKEDWQSKVFIPQQAKKSETAFSYLDKMLFGQKRFFNITGVEKKDKEESGYIEDLYDVIFDRGNFYLENDFVLNEGCQIVTCFLKLLIKPDRSGLDFIWRSTYNISFDPSCGYNFHKAKYVCDEYKKTLNELVDDLSKPNPLYTREVIQKVIDLAEQAGQGKSDADLTTIKGIDGTAQIVIAKDWFEVIVVEYWGKVKEVIEEKSGDKTIKQFRTKDKIVVVVNDKVKIR